MSDSAAAYLSEALRALRAYKRLAEGALAQLSDQDFFASPIPSHSAPP